MGDWRVPGYTELKPLGEGAQGRVVLARHDASGRSAAIKYLAPALTADAAFRARFRGEAELLRRLRNPYVAGMFGLVEVPGGAAIVMEAVDGASLKAVLAERGALAPEAALALLKGSLLGLAAAHDLGIVHRDYKPANVIVRGDGLSKLIDFGIAVDAGEAGRSGTPVYMAPEQWRAEPASPATDVYAATCVFFECVTGRRPYAADNQAAMMHHHLAGTVPAEAVPEPLRPLVQRGLAKSPWERPPGAAAFVSELETAAAAAYGRDWEINGVRALAGAAAALSMLFPLAALGLSPAGTGAGAAGTGTGAAAASGKGVLGVVGAKGAAAIAGGTVVAVAAGGTAVYVAADEKPAKRRPVAAVAPMTFDLAGLREATTAPPFTVNGQVVSVKGGDAALAKQINAALRAPVDARQREYRRILTSSNAVASASTVKADLLVRGPRYLSVRYDIVLNSPTVTHASWNRIRTVVVDLKTGRPLPPSQILTPAGLSASGLRALSSRVSSLLRSDEADCLGGPLVLTRTRVEGRGAAVQFALRPKGLEVLVDAPAFDFAMACGQPGVQIPYDGLKGLIRPEVVQAVGTPVPAPTRS